MARGTQQTRTGSLELAHHYVGGDGAAALQALLSGFDGGDHACSVRETQYDNLRLQVKSRILGQDPPDVWTGWPGGEIEGYAEVNVVEDVTEIWESTGMDETYRSVVADAARVNGRYYTVPITVHRINDLYVHPVAAERAGIDPSSAGTPAALVEMLEEAAAETGGPGMLLPMADPFPTLQLWEVMLLGESDHRTFQEITDGNARRHRGVIEDVLSLIERIASLATGDAIYEGLVDANEQFRAGLAPVYPQGDWAGGVFVDAEDFEFGHDWDRIPFPGTENMYAVVIDTVIPSNQSESDALAPFLQYVGSTDGQERFSRKKGSLPARADASMDGFSDFARSQKAQFDQSSTHPQTITHGLSVSPTQLVDLKVAIAEFLDAWDTRATADEMVAVFDE